MLNIMEVHETNKMIEQEKLDVRTITMGISLLDCAADSVDEVCENIYNKITTYAKDLVSTGQSIERDFGIPIVNKRITVTPISLVGASSCKSSEDFRQDRARARPCCQEGRCRPDRRLFRTRVQVHDPGRGDAYPFTAAGAFRNGHRVFTP